MDLKFSWDPVSRHWFAEMSWVKVVVPLQFVLERNWNIRTVGVSTALVM